MDTTSIQKNLFEVQIQRIDVSPGKITKLTVLNSKIIAQRLIGLVRQRNTIVNLDLSGIQFIDSTAISMFNNLMKVALLHGSELVLSEVEPSVLEIIDLVRKHGQFNIDTVYCSRNKKAA